MTVRKKTELPKSYGTGSGYFLIYNFSTIPSHATSACSSEKRSLSSSSFPTKTLPIWPLHAARRHFMIDEPLFGERGRGREEKDDVLSVALQRLAFSVAPSIGSP